MAHHAAGLPACANCHYDFVPGEPAEFCPRCGQQNHPVALGLGHVLEEFLEGVFHFDGKVFRTLRLLLLLPGELTQQFLAGHRAPFVPPIRLYVFISFVFFFLFTLGSHHDDGHPATRAHKPEPMGLLAELDAPAAQRPPSSVQLSQLDFERLPVGLTTAEADSVLRHYKVEVNGVSRLVVQHMPRLSRLGVEEVTHQVLKAVSVMLFGLLPLSALLLLLAYGRQRHYYVSHLLFAVHVHCFVFVLLAVLLGLDYLPLPDGTGFFLALGLLAWYWFKALRRFYGQGWPLTLVKGTALLLAYGLLLSAGLLGALALGLHLV